MTKTTGPTLQDAAQTFGKTFDDGMLADVIATRLTCDELDALVGLLRAAGFVDAATGCLNSHARRDEEGDAHYQDAPRDQHRPRSEGCSIVFDPALDTDSAEGPCPVCEPLACVTDDELAQIDAAVEAFDPADLSTLNTSTEETNR